MIQPNDLKQTLPVELSNGIVSTTARVWEMLVASRNGDLRQVQELEEECPGLIYAQYNYTPPIHFAVREGHLQLVEYLLDKGAYDPSYKIYPFLDSLATIANDRGHAGIQRMLEEYQANPSRQQFSGDNGRIIRPRTTLQTAFETAVDKDDLDRTAEILNDNPAFALDETYFWGEGILTKPAQHGALRMIELLMSHGARVPDILKWTQFYYFKKYDTAAFLMDKGMNPDVKSWQEVTILHDMAQKGDTPKAKLLIAHGAGIDPLEDEYLSTPLGLAARWGHADMVEHLLAHGADPNRSGAPWSTPLAWARRKGHTNIEKLLLRYIG